MKTTSKFIAALLILSAALFGIGCSSMHSNPTEKCTGVHYTNDYADDYPYYENDPPEGYVFMETFSESPDVFMFDEILLVPDHFTEGDTIIFIKDGVQTILVTTN